MLIYALFSERHEPSRNCAHTINMWSVRNYDHKRNRQYFDSYKHFFLISSRVYCGQTEFANQSKAFAQFMDILPPRSLSGWLRPCVILVVHPSQQLYAVCRKVPSTCAGHFLIQEHIILKMRPGIFCPESKKVYIPGQILPYYILRNKVQHS